MKKIFLILAVLLGLSAQSAFAEAMLQPDPSKTYAIKHSSGHYLTVDGNYLKINEKGAGPQKFTFELGEINADDNAQMYLIKTEEGKYVGFTTSNHYDYKFYDAPNANYTNFSIWESHEPDCVKIYNYAKAYMGTDSNSANSGVYADKNGLDGKHAWMIVEYEEGVDYSALESTIADAEAILADEDVTIGDEVGMYPQSAADALQAAIDAAKALLSSNDQAEVNEGRKVLQAAIDAFNKQLITFKVEEGSKYYFYHNASGLMMSLTNNEATLENLGAENQRWEFVPVEGANGSFSFKVADKFLTLSGGWNTTAVDDNSSDNSKFTLRPVNLDKAVYYISRFSGSGYLAPDELTPGKKVFTNKGTGSYAEFTIIKYVEGQLITLGFDKAVATAESLASTSEIGDGDWQYPQSALDALNEAIATAKNGEYADQEALDAATAALNDAIAAFRAAQLMPTFKPRENTMYRFSVNKYEDKHLTNNGTDAKTTEAYTPGLSGQHWTFVQTAPSTFIVKNGDMALAYDGTMVDATDAETAPKWMTVYTNTKDNLDYFALVEAEDPTKVMTFSSGKSFVVQALATTNNAHQGRFIRVLDPVVDPNLSSFEKAIAAARVALKNVDRGPAVGQYSDAKCDAFEALIEQTEAIESATQAEIDAATAALNKARTDFLANPNSVIKDELEAAIAAAKEKAAAAEVGIEIGQYYMSAIEAFLADIAEFEKSAANVSEQDACDALTEEVKAATEAFKGNESVQAVADVLNDYISSCEALYEAEKDNVGTDKGQRPQTAVDAFRAAIDKAKALTAPGVDDLQTLIEAREAFLAGAVSVDRTALRKAIDKADGEAYQNLTAGEFDGNYGADEIADFEAALATAKDVEADMSKTQEEVDAATAALTAAMTALDKSKVTINFKGLDDAIAQAEAAIAKATVVGEQPGQCPASVVAALQNVLDQAKNADRTTMTQQDVVDMIIELTDATGTFTNELVASTGLADAIAAAQAVLDDAVEGMTPGDYPHSAIAGLENAIATAIAVRDNTASTQEELIAAVGTLNDAVDRFKTQAIPAHDLTEINALIAEAEAYIAAGCDDQLLALYLEEAKDVVADADNKTAAEIKKAHDNLKRALENAGWSGIEAITIDGVAIMTNGGLTIAGLPEGALVSVYSLDGRLMATAVADGTVRFNLIAGRYVLCAVAEGKAMTQVVSVR